jgi:rhamnopyranosyl-N-acetylglucosaminyl-diphospho-decaprenol beta-1,3/1,4-galactofuranosyltransferase
VTVCAVVVTFDRRELLAECLDAIDGQTRPPERVLVVDNASTDGTAELLRARDGIASTRLERNAGSSGGFAAGIEAGARTGADWLWVMDDDAAPDPDALERLLGSPAAADPGTAVLAQAVVGPDGSIDLAHRGRFHRRPRPLALAEYEGTPELGFFTFVGILLRRSAVEAAGLPDPRLFIWADDFEYSLRVREHGRIRLVPASRIVHKDAGHGLTNRRSRLWNRLFGWDYAATPTASAWRNICGARNYIWVKKRYEGQGALSAAGTVTQLVVKALLYDEQPLRRIPWLVRYGIEGRRGVFRNFSPEEWRALARGPGWRLALASLSRRRPSPPAG